MAITMDCDAGKIPEESEKNVFRMFGP